MDKRLIASAILTAAAACSTAPATMSFDAEARLLAEAQNWRPAARPELHSATHDHLGEAESVAVAIRKAASPPDAAERFADAARRGGDTVLVTLAGPYCGLCAAKINNALEDRDAVAASAIDPRANRLSIALAPGETLDDARIRKIVTRSGYRPAAILRGDDARRALDEGVAR
jgi:copper chaperone CopZ